MRVHLLGIPTDAQTFDEALDKIITWGMSTPHSPKRVSTCAVHTLMSAKEDSLVYAALASADMVATDGMPLVWLQQYLGYSQAERVYGPDLLLALCEAGLPHHLKHYFWGGVGEVPAQLSKRLQARFPDLQISGYYAPPVSILEKQAQADTIQRLNALPIDILWVGLGSPKQDMWMALYAPHLTAKVIIGVGAAFDFHSGNKRQAPHWMQRIGLEWFFRLQQEPRRLGRRYLVYNSRFLYHVFYHYVLKNLH